MSNQEPPPRSVGYCGRSMKCRVKRLQCPKQGKGFSKVRKKKLDVSLCGWSLIVLVLCSFSVFFYSFFDSCALNWVYPYTLSPFFLLPPPLSSLPQSSPTQKQCMKRPGPKNPNCTCRCTMLPPTPRPTWKRWVWCACPSFRRCCTRWTGPVSPCYCPT